MKSKYFKLFKKYYNHSPNTSNIVSTRKETSLYVAQNYIKTSEEKYSTYFTFYAGINLLDADIRQFNEKMNLFQKAYKAEINYSEQGKKVKHSKERKIQFTKENFVNAIGGYVYVRLLKLFKQYIFSHKKKIEELPVDNINENYVCSAADFLHFHKPISLRPYLYFYPLITSYLYYNASKASKEDIRVDIEAPNNKKYVVYMSTSPHSAKEKWFLRLVEVNPDSKKQNTTLFSVDKGFSFLPLEAEKSTNVAVVQEEYLEKTCFDLFVEFLDGITETFEDIIGY